MAGLEENAVAMNRDELPDERPWSEEKSRCAKCGSERIVANVGVFDQGQYSDGTLKVVFEQKPEAWFFKRPVLSALRATICGVCGYTEMFVENPQEIYEAARRLAGNGNCEQCGAAMDAHVRACPSCGWTYDAQEPE